VTATLKQVAALVERESGIIVRDSQFTPLIAALERTGWADDPGRFLRLVSDPVDGASHMARLLDDLTVKETFFLRELEALRQIAWQELFDRAWAHGTENARIWSAGCATGEEAYTLAVLAWEAAGGKTPPVTIVATDISERALSLARTGEYRPRSTRQLEPSLRRRYFHQRDGQLLADERLRSLVTFARHNLVRDPVPPIGEPRFDVILCRNVLIYFDRATADRVMAALESALVPSGTLILGAADTLGRAARRLRPLAAPAAATAPRATPANPTLAEPDRATGAPAIDEAPAIADAITDAGTADEVMAEAAALLAIDPLNASAHFLAGLAKLASGDPDAAVLALRKALYVEPYLAPAAFALGRAYESIGDRAAARQSYERMLRMGDERTALEPLLAQIDTGDLAAAAKARLAALPGRRASID